jgi:hypothetical protein
MLHVTQIDPTVIRDSWEELIAPGAILARSRELRANLPRNEKFATRIRLQWFYLYRALFLYSAKPGSNLRREDAKKVRDDLAARKPSSMTIVARVDAPGTPLAGFPEWYLGSIVAITGSDVRIRFRQPDIADATLPGSSVRHVDGAWAAARAAAPDIPPCPCPECAP